MSRRRAGSQGSLGPDDEVMPYSDDETDDELAPSTDGEAEELPGVLHPSVEAKVSGEALQRFSNDNNISVLFILISTILINYTGNPFCQTIFPRDTIISVCPVQREVHDVF